MAVTDAIHQGHPKIGGRVSGVPNKQTAEIRELARALLESPEYQASLKRRLLAGKAPQLEVLMHYYAYGKPVAHVDVIASLQPDFRGAREELASRLARLAAARVQHTAPDTE